MKTTTITMPWKPIATANKDRRILLYYPAPIFNGLEVVCGKWEEDKYAKKPRPYWSAEGWFESRSTISRGQKPTHWMELPGFPDEDET